MANDISGQLPIGPQQLGNASQLGQLGKTPTTEQGDSFKDVLMKSLEEVDRLQKDADRAFQGLATGKTQDVTEVLSAVQKADLAFKTLMQIRNKLIDAYDELRQMRI